MCKNQYIHLKLEHVIQCFQNYCHLHQYLMKSPWQKLTALIYFDNTSQGWRQLGKGFWITSSYRTFLDP